MISPERELIIKSSSELGNRSKKRLKAAPLALTNGWERARIKDRESVISSNPGGEDPKQGNLCGAGLLLVIKSDSNL